MKPQAILEPGGAAAAQLAHLGTWTLAIFAVTIVVTWLLIGWLGRRNRGTLDWHAPVDEGGGQSWILAGGIAAPLLVFALLFGLTLKSMNAFPMAAAQAPAQLRVVGHQWWFEAEYRFDDPSLAVHVPTEIHVPVGKPVDIELESRDVIHSFWVPRLHGKVDLIPGQHNRIRIRADEPGTYSGECAEFCGMQHAHMRFQVVAETPADYERWLAKQREHAVEPSSDETRRGREAFMAAACPLCHTIRGTAARGSVGPDLTHVGSRATIAGGSFENRPQTLEAWISHAQSLKPGAQMPDRAVFDARDLHAVAAYLGSLR